MVSVLLVVLGTAALMMPSAAAAISVNADAQAAAALATAAGYRTGVAVLDLASGQYTGAGDDTAAFASESIAKVLIATQLLLTGQMTGSVETTAYQMITESDDADADALYGLAGGDDVIDLVAAHYGIPALGTAPSRPGWWGNTEINAKGLVYLYAAIAKDPLVGPWLMNAMANATEYGADGTYQFFGLPSATAGAAIKQGWGDDGDDSPNAVFNSSGYVDQDQYAVAILTDGPPSSYGAAISAVVTEEAKALMPGGRIDDPAAHNPTIAAATVTATGNTVRVTGRASDPDAPGAGLPIVVSVGEDVVAAGRTAADGTFAISFAAGNGSHTYTVTAGNLGEGTADTLVTIAAIAVNGDPTGAVTSVAGGPGQLTISGTEFDPNPVPDAQLTVSIDGSSPQVESLTDQDGARSSYAVTLAAPTGHHEVTIAYVDQDTGDRVGEGTWPVTVEPAPAQRRAHLITWIVGPSAGGTTLALLVLGGLWHRRRSGRPAPRSPARPIPA